jgi:hypothetical protein
MCQARFCALEVLTVLEDPMTDSLARLRADVTRDDVVRAIQEYDRLGPERFFSEHGFGPTTTYDLVWDERRYPPKAILGTAYEFATGQRLESGDFEGGRAGAVAVLGKLGFTVEHKPQSAS